MSVHAGAEEEYEKRHNPIWPELEKVREDRRSTHGHPSGVIPDSLFENNRAQIVGLKKDFEFYERFAG